MAGNLTVPNIISQLGGGNQPASLLDDNWASIVNYINLRQTFFGTLAGRPSPTGLPNGIYYLATDKDGGTFYQTNGGAWVQLAPGVNATPPNVPGTISSINYQQGSRAGNYTTTSGTFVDVDSVNLRATVSVPVAAKFIVAMATFSLLGSLISDGNPHVQILAAGFVMGPWNWMNNATLTPGGPFTVFGVVAGPPSGTQTVSLQYSGDGVNSITINNGALEGASASGFFIVPKMLVLVTT